MTQLHAMHYSSIDELTKEFNSETVPCRICFKRFKLLGPHLATHKITAVDYRKMMNMPKRFGLVGIANKIQASERMTKKHADGEMVYGLNCGTRDHSNDTANTSTLVIPRSSKNKKSTSTAKRTVPTIEKLIEVCNTANAMRQLPPKFIKRLAAGNRDLFEAYHSAFLKYRVMKMISNNAPIPLNHKLGLAESVLYFWRANVNQTLHEKTDFIFLKVYVPYILKAADAQFHPTPTAEDTFVNTKKSYPKHLQTTKDMTSLEKRKIYQLRYKYNHPLLCKSPQPVPIAEKITLTKPFVDITPQLAEEIISKESKWTIKTIIALHRNNVDNTAIAKAFDLPVEEVSYIIDIANIAMS